MLIPVLTSPLDMRAAADFIGTIKKNDRVANKHAKIALIVTV